MRFFTLRAIVSPAAATISVGAVPCSQKSEQAV